MTHSIAQPKGAKGAGSSDALPAVNLRQARMKHGLLGVEC